MATMQEQSDLVVDQIQERSDQAEAQLALTIAAIDDTRLAIDAAITAMAANAISIDTAGVDTTYVAPTAVAPTIPAAPAAPTAPVLPVAPTIPPADSIAISDAAWDAAFLRAQGLQDRIKVKNEALATHRAAALGHDEWSETQAVLLAEARDRGDEETSKNALASAVAQETALREDVIALVGPSIQSYASQGEQQINNFRALSEEQRRSYVEAWRLALDNYRSQWETKTRSEVARLDYERLELAKVTDPERVRAEFDVKKTELSAQNAVGQLVDLVQVYAQLSSALFAGADVNLGSSVGMSFGPTKYNPTEGEVVIYPT